ncbi:hypothetical protein DEU56DRAFT_892845 [Suillus clintonianus]|uniref:uncharacterized protein n=1 Tax=Suillus clintonianus TaxID=1904413 RepID=UPI001B86A8AF|nr:uncharacterized protein DEU56DRAFT_892845 [Suillus clintonianus]KAG2124883.1 hypothetical protein DEU56DRAFT_892845 [Suillus clintonianus]
MHKNDMVSPNNILCQWQDIVACIEFKRKQPASDTAPTVLSSRLTAAQLQVQLQAQGQGYFGIAAKKTESKPDGTDTDLDVTIQKGLYAAEFFAAKVEEIAKVHATSKDDTPELLWHHTLTTPTFDIREALSVQEPTKGSRVLYILESRKLQPITGLHGIKFFDAWQQCIKCHVALWKGGVYHRDVSPGNMMWYEKDGKLIGVLNDYDLSSLASDRGPRGNERTGTIPFMAIDLLTAKGQRGEVKHMYRYDMESFVWVFIWVCLRYREGVLLETGSRPLDKWATKSAVECGQMKHWFLRELENYYPTDIEKHMRFFIVDCVEILLEDSKDRTSRRNLLLKSEATKQSDDEGPEDIDGFLSKFTSMSTWKDLIKLINSSQ